jgi:hypothetical protein
MAEKELRDHLKSERRVRDGALGSRPNAQSNVWDRTKERRRSNRNACSCAVDAAKARAEKMNLWRDTVLFVKRQNLSKGAAIRP